jgi:membrane protein DedA with SNARE-associated domain
VWDWISSLPEFFANLLSGAYLDLGVWSYILLAVLVATEGPLSTLVGATAAAAGLLDVRLVLFATVVGNVIGDTLWYSLGYMGKMNWLFEHAGWLGVRPRHVERLEREMQTHCTKLIIFAKIAYGLIVPTLVAAGMARVPWRRWFPVVFVVETLWSILLVWIGFHATAFIHSFERGLHALGVAVLIGGVGFVLFRLLRKRIDLQELQLDPLNPVESDKVAPVKPTVGKEKATVVEVVAPHYESMEDEQNFMALPEKRRVDYFVGDGFVCDREDLVAPPVGGSGSSAWSARRTPR